MIFLDFRIIFEGLCLEDHGTAQRRIRGVAYNAELEGKKLAGTLLAGGAASEGKPQPTQALIHLGPQFGLYRNLEASESVNKGSGLAISSIHRSPCLYSASGCFCGLSTRH